MTVTEGGVGGAIRRAVIIGNGFAGAENQCFGLVRALGLSQHYTLYVLPSGTELVSVRYTAKELHTSQRPRGGINEWLRWLPVSALKRFDHFKRQIYDPCFKSSAKGLSDVLDADAKQIAKIARDTFEKNGPLLVVASGRDTIAVASSIKQLAAKHVFAIQIQHPRSQLNKFDLVITPRHDYYPFSPQGQDSVRYFFRRWITRQQPLGRHVVLTVGALHQVDSTALQRAVSAWHDEFVSLQKPLLVVNIGGPTRHCRYGSDLAKQLTASLNSILSNCGSVRISFSRRTPKEVRDILVREFCNNPKVYIWDGKGPNPHMGHLAWADAFVITADSVSMLSEACSTGKPVYVIGAELCTWKFANFQNSLRQQGMVRPFTGKENISERWNYTPLRDTAEAADRVIEALTERGWEIAAIK